MFFSLRLAALTLSTTTLFISHAFGLAIPLVERSEQLCNGHPELCDRSYGNITFVGAHDSFAYSPNPFALSRTQEVDVDTQLRLGVRLLQGMGRILAFATPVSLQKSNSWLLYVLSTLTFLTSLFTIACGLYNGGKVENYFRKVKNFLDRHPNEVLTIIIANPGNVSAKVWKPIMESTGLAEMAYVPPQTPMMRQEWPTLRQMLDSGKRLVFFIDKGADEGVVPYILPEFTMVWEDEYDPTDRKFPCKVDRTSGPLSPSQKLNVANHNLNVDLMPIGRGIRLPDRLNTPRTNGVKLITAHANHCAPLAGDKYPNFVLVDFVNVGQAVTAVARLNGFPY